MKPDIKRLKMLSKMLKNHDKIFADVEFNMHCWIVPKKRGNVRCGTAACALGSAGCYPPFREMGLKSISGRNAIVGTVRYGEDINFTAAEKFFGIGCAASRFLFSPTCYAIEPDPKEVARRVDGIIEKYK